MVKIIELSIVIVYSLIVLGIGYYFKSRRTADDFWKAGGSIGTFINSLAIFSAIASGGTFLGAIGLSYQLGVTLWWSTSLGTVLGFLFAAVLVVKPLRRVEVRTIPDIFSYLYENKYIDAITPIPILVGYFMFVVAQLNAAGLVAGYLLNLDYVLAVSGVGLIFIAYISIGGMWAITFTDFLQAFLMGGLMIVIGTYSFAFFDWSFKAPIQAVPRIVGTGSLPATTYLGFALLLIVGISIFPHIAMRAFSAKNPQSAKRAYAWSGLLYVLVTLPYFFIASAAFSIDPNLANPDTAALVVMNTILPDIVAGGAAAAILAAVMSSTDAALLAMGAAISNDLYGNIINPEASEDRIVQVGTLSIIALGLLSIIAAWNPPRYLVELYADGWALMGSALFFPLVLGLWWKRMNKNGALAGIIIGSITYIVIYFYVPMFSAIVYALPVSFVFCVAGSLVSAPRSEEVREKLSEELGHNRLGW